MYSDNHNDIYDNNNHNNNRNQFDLSLSNVKYDDWSNCACLKKTIVNIRRKSH